MFCCRALQILAFGLDATSLAYSIRANRIWKRICGSRLQIMIDATVVIQRSSRVALAILHTTQLRAFRFKHALYTNGYLCEIPRNLWVSHHACIFGSARVASNEFWLAHISFACDSANLFTLKWAIEKLTWNGMPVAAPLHNLGKGVLSALMFLSTLSLDQLICLGI